MSLDRVEPGGAEKQLGLQWRIPNLCTFEKKKKKKVPETFYLSLCGLERLELIMRLLYLDSRGRGMLHVLKVSAAD